MQEVEPVYVYLVGHLRIVQLISMNVHIPTVDHLLHALILLAATLVNVYQAMKLVFLETVKEKV